MKTGARNSSATAAIAAFTARLPGSDRSRGVISDLRCDAARASSRVSGISIARSVRSTRVASEMGVKRVAIDPRSTPSGGVWVAKSGGVMSATQGENERDEAGYRDGALHERVPVRGAAL